MMLFKIKLHVCIYIYYIVYTYITYIHILYYIYTYIILYNVENKLLYIYS